MLVNPHLQISDYAADIFISAFDLNNRAFRVALIESLEVQTVPNPFNDNL